MPSSESEQPAEALPSVVVSNADVSPEAEKEEESQEPGIPALPDISSTDPKALQAILDERLGALDVTIKAVKTRSEPLLKYVKQLEKRLEPAKESGFGQLTRTIETEIEQTRKMIEVLQIDALPEGLVPTSGRPDFQSRKAGGSGPTHSDRSDGSPTSMRPTPVMEAMNRSAPPVYAPIPRPAHTFTLNDLNDFTNWAVEFRDRAEDLKRDSGVTDPRELRILVEMLAFEGRIEQDRWAGHPKEGPWEHAYQTSVRGFGALTSIATGFLNPLGISVRGIRRDQRLNWVALLDEAKTKLAEMRTRIESEAQMEERRREIEERERAIAMDRERRAALLRGSITEAINEIVENRNPEADEQLLELVGQYIDLTTVDHWLADEVFRLQGLMDFKEFFSGSNFRLLRKKLERKEGDEEESSESDANPAVDGEAVDSDEAEDDEIDEDSDVIDKRYPGFRGLFQDLRGMLAGGKRKAVAEGELKNFFGFAEFEWMETSRTAAVDRRLEARVLNRQYDVVVLLARFLSKSTQDALRQACKEVGIPCLILSHGYGKGAMVQAIIQWREGQGA